MRHLTHDKSVYIETPFLIRLIRRSIYIWGNKSPIGTDQHRGVSLLIAPRSGDRHKETDAGGLDLAADSSPRRLLHHVCWSRSFKTPPGSH